MKAIIYCRKSTESEEKQVQSIEAQLDWCRDYAKRGNFEVIKEVIEEKSAKAPGRPGFNDMMQYFPKNKADIIISWKLNRLSRNPIDEGTIKWLCQSFTIKEIHTVDGISNGNNILLMSVHFGMANQFLVDLSKDIKRGMDKKAQNGEWGRRSPLGYNVKDKIAVIDKEKAPHIRKIFKLKFEEKLNNAEIARILKEDGLVSRPEKRKGVLRPGTPLDHKRIGVILKNPFYYGVIAHKGEIFEGKHKPLVSKKIWDEINQVETKKYNFYKKGILKGKVVFKDTMKPMCVTEKVKTNKTNDKVRKYIYYHTAGENQVWMSEKNIIKFFDDNIKNYCIPKEYSEQIIEAIYLYHNNQIEKNTLGKKEINKTIEKLEKKKKAYMEMRASGELDHEEFIEFKNGITNEIIDLKERSKEINRLDSKVLESLSNSVELLVNLYDSYKSMNESDKLQLIDIILVELVVDKEKVAFIKEKPLFQFIRKCLNPIWWS